MHSANLAIHLQKKEVPKVAVKSFHGFYVVDIIISDNLGINFFIDSPQELLNFKNNLLWAFENPIDMNMQ